MDSPVAYLNGRFVPASDAAISVWDAGFVLGATVTEQLRTFGGRLFRVEEHLARLQRSLEIAGIELNRPLAALADVAVELVAKNHPLLPAGHDLGLAVLVTPGPYATLAGIAVEPGPTVILHTYPLPFAQWASKYERGERLVLTSVEQVPSRCWPSELKCRSRMHYYLADRAADAIEPGAKALLLDEAGRVVETAIANVLLFCAHEGLLSPRRECVLPGISLGAVADLAARLDVPLRYRDLLPNEVATADEVLLTSTPYCLLPVTRFCGKPIGTGTPGPMYHRLLAAWSDLVGLDIAAQAQRAAV